MTASGGDVDEWQDVRVDLAGLGPWEWDLRESVMHWSDELYRVFGVEPDEFGHEIDAYLERVHPEDRAWVAQRMRTAADEACSYRVEHRIVRPDGSVDWLHCRGEPVLEDGEVVRLYGLACEMTPRRVDDEDRWRTFLEDAVHELRAPVATLVQAADLLATRFEDLERPDVEATLAAIRRQGARLRALASDLLDLSALEHTSEVRSEESVDLAAGVADALEVMPPPEDIDVDTGGVEAVGVRVRAQPLERILVNLLANAYAYGGDRVTVRTFADGPDGVLEVCDNGPGVPDGLRDHLFRAFGPSRDESGTGLGLSIVRRLAERADGDVDYRDIPGGGACFVVRLPRSGPSGPV